jgi:ABC-type Mn2+/Zn2+ transport system ATPase subunit
MRLLVDISKKGKAILMATHDFHLMEKFPSRTLKCENGVVIDTPNAHLKRAAVRTDLAQDGERAGGENL